MLREHELKFFGISIDIDEEYQNKILKICRELLEKTSNIEVARTRVVFIFDEYVIKVPNSLDGFRANDWEGSVSTNCFDNTDTQYAKAELIEIDDIPLVKMEYVKYASEKDILERLGFYPDWVSSIDCGQVGFNKDGLLVAFDFAC